MRNNFTRLMGGVAAALTAIALTGQASAEKVKLAYVVLDSGNPGTTLSSGCNTMETASVKCDSHRGACGISPRIMSSLSHAACQDDWRIVGLVDGNNVDGGPIQDELPLSDVTHTGTWQGLYYVDYGIHTVAFQLYVPCAAAANQLSVRYIVTKS